MADETRAPSRRWIHTRIGRLVSPALALLIALPLGANGSASGDRLVVAARDAHAKRDAAAARLCASPARDRATPARALGRLLGPEPASRARLGARGGVVLLALERQLRRGPPAQRLAARARQAARLAGVPPRLPALPHERRPAGHLLRDHGRAPRGQARARARARGLARAARCGRRLPAHGAHAALGGRVRRAGGVAQGAPRHRVEPLGRRTQRARPARGGAGCAARRGGASPRRRWPGRRRRRPADALDALAVARLASTDPALAARRLEAGLDTRLPPEWAAWAWAQVGRQAVRCGCSRRRPRISGAPRRPRCAPASR